jgi:hypothetical protein
MTARWGRALYWTATAIAGLIAVWIVWGYVYNIDRGEPIVRLAPLLLAGLIWLAGWACRYALARR